METKQLDPIEKAIAESKKQRTKTITKSFIITNGIINLYEDVKANAKYKGWFATHSWGEKITSIKKNPNTWYAQYIDFERNEIEVKDLKRNHIIKVKKCERKAKGFTNLHQVSIDVTYTIYEAIFLVKTITKDKVTFIQCPTIQIAIEQQNKKRK